MSRPPKIVIPGVEHGIPAGYVVGRPRNAGHGPAQFLDLAALRQLGVAGQATVAQNISTVNSEIASLSAAVSGSLSTVVSEITSLSTVVGAGTAGRMGPPGQDGEDGQDYYYMIGSSGTDDDTALSTSLSGAVSSITSLSSAVSSVDAGQSTSISTNLSKINSLSTAISAGNAIYAPLCTGDIPGPILMANADGACIMVGISP